MQILSLCGHFFLSIHKNAIFATNFTVMKRASFVILLILAVLGQTFSQVDNSVSENKALQTAKAFVNSKSSFQNAELQLVSASDLFIYNIGDQGFVIISGNTVLPPVLAYSNQGNFPDLEEAPENFASWIRHYDEMIEYAVTDFPEPDSPTMPRISPGFRSKLTPFTACTSPLSVKNDV